MREEIKYNPIVVFINLFVSIVIAGIWLQIFTRKEVWGSYWEIILFAVVTFVVLSKFTRTGILGLFGRPAVILTDEYIKLITNGYQISWADISHMELSQFTNRGATAFSIVLTLKDEGKYLQQLNDPFMRLYYKYRKAEAHPFTISLAELKGNPQELYRLIEEYYIRLH